jgi:hypothetical protein
LKRQLGIKDRQGSREITQNANNYCDTNIDRFVDSLHASINSRQLEFRFHATHAFPACNVLVIWAVFSRAIRTRAYRY